MNKYFIALIPLALLLTLSSVRIVSAEIYYDNDVFNEPIIFDDNIEFWAELNSEGQVKMEWSKYDQSLPFEFYKVVRSQTNDNPIYPNDGHLSTTEDINVLNFTDDEVPYGDNYYRICSVASPKRYCSTEVMKISKKAPFIIHEGMMIDMTKIKPDLVDLDPKPGVEPIEVPDIKDVEEVITPIKDVIPPKVEVILENSELKEEASVVQEDKNSIESFFSEYWVQFLALVVSLIGVALAITGFTLAGSKKRKSISRLLNNIDDTFASFKWKTKRCEAELYRLQDVVEDELKAGKLDEGSYQLLLKRIENYLAEIQEIDKLPDHLKEK